MKNEITITFQNPETSRSDAMKQYVRSQEIHEEHGTASLNLTGKADLIRSISAILDTQ
jgi:hypothetical protein